MSDQAADHRHAAARHEEAAETHERAAAFWDERQDQGRAELQREMADHERRGAALELRWAELTEPGATHPASRAGELVMRSTRQGAEHLSAILTRTAEALQRSASLADQHAERRTREGRDDDAAEERKAADRAREAAGRARSQAEGWLKLSEPPRS